MNPLRSPTVYAFKSHTGETSAVKKKCKWMLMQSRKVVCEVFGIHTSFLIGFRKVSRAEIGEFEEVKDSNVLPCVA
ncbi:hypothetical protein MKW98_004822 [Papaver atlanticum]|uniref:Uncharacterized protein n=1 Tax=Papaver atlanticum TaxID=357466 RepID=A0AAD4SI31_9MAGN|nr:hypothetical protein MKW98_004822 [Papaver atlanticum]